MIETDNMPIDLFLDLFLYSCMTKIAFYTRMNSIFITNSSPDYCQQFPWKKNPSAYPCHIPLIHVWGGFSGEENVTMGTLTHNISPTPWGKLLSFLHSFYIPQEGLGIYPWGKPMISALCHTAYRWFYFWKSFIIKIIINDTVWGSYLEGTDRL